MGSVFLIHLLMYSVMQCACNFAVRGNLFLPKAVSVRHTDCHVVVSSTGVSTMCIHWGIRVQGLH